MKVRVVEPFTFRGVSGFFRAYLRPGVIEVSDADGAVMLERGLVVDPTVPAAAPVSEPAPASNPEPDGETAPEAETPDGVKRPRKTARVDAWRDYAESKGIDPKGMTKAELIAAVG